MTITIRAIDKNLGVKKDLKTSSEKNTEKDINKVLWH